MKINKKKIGRISMNIILGSLVIWFVTMLINLSTLLINLLRVTTTYLELNQGNFSQESMLIAMLFMILITMGITGFMGVLTIKTIYLFKNKVSENNK